VVPSIIETVRSTFHNLCALRDQCTPPIISLKEALRILDFIQSPSIGLQCINSLYSLGWIMIIRWPSYDGNELVENAFLILDPKWLALLLSSVVTMRHSFAKDGILSLEDLKSIWHSVPPEYHNPLLHLMNHLDVLLPLDSNRLLVPCLLPPNRPDHIALSLVGGHVLRRSFILDEEVSMPIGAIGKVIAASLRWGSVKYGWRDGCVVIKNNVSFFLIYICI
jgi:hypothetical protein